MSPENTAALVAAAPLLYRNLGGDPMVTCMAWGFECGDGWFDLLLEASVLIEAEIRKLRSEGVPEEQLPVASQVKEKFGTLRFYTDFSTEAILTITNAAELRSCTTCEVCGSPGHLRGGGWLTTRCEECANESGS